MKIILQQFAVFRRFTKEMCELLWSYASLKISIIADPEHVNDVMFILVFTQVTLPLMSSRELLRSQAKEIIYIVALIVLAFVLNISVN